MVKLAVRISIAGFFACMGMADYTGGFTGEAMDFVGGAFAFGVLGLAGWLVLSW